jgi:putative transposase
MSFRQRRLPHLHGENQPLFLTWRLRGSLPSHRFFPPGRLTSGRAFVAMDRLLDNARNGPLYLSREEAARVVVEAILNGQNTCHHYRLHAFVVMANHVHLLLTPTAPVSKLMNWLKGTTARRVNQILGLTGKALWQDESYDRLVRNEGEFRRIQAYIEENPVRAGLVAAPEDYPWSSASRRFRGEAPG